VSGTCRECPAADGDNLSQAARALAAQYRQLLV
jgi:hypothetical protein